MVLLASQVSFQHKLMNNANTFLLLDVNFLIALVQSDSVITAPASVVLIHILVIGPILCIVGWNDHSIHVNAPTQQKVYYIEEDGEREPLIRIVDYH